MQTPGMLYPGDDYSYFSYSTALSFFQYPHFENEYVDEFNVPPLSRVGPGLMAAPFVFTFSLIDRITHHPIVEKRTKENILTSYSSFGAPFSSAFYFWMSLLFLYLGLLHFVSKKASEVSVILLVLCQGAALFAFRRPMFAHSFELFLHSALFYFWTKKCFQKENKRDFLWVVVFSTMLPLVRQNALPYIILWPLIYIFTAQSWSVQTLIQNFKNIVLSIVSALALFQIIKNIPFWLNPIAYEAVNKAFETTNFLTKFYGMYFYFKRTLTVFFGMDWGLIYTAPFLVLSMVLHFSQKYKFKKEILALSLPVFLNLYICIIWQGQGGWYGYRYFIFTAFVIFIVPFAIWIEKILMLPKKYLYLLMLIAFFPVLSMLTFEGAQNLQIVGVTTEFGEKNGGNLDYQINVWKLFFTEPIHFLITVLKAGPAYLIYVVMNLFGISSHLPAKFQELYASFDLKILIKSMLFYIQPFILYYIFSIKSQKFDNSLHSGPER